MLPGRGNQDSVQQCERGAEVDDPPKNGPDQADMKVSVTFVANDFPAAPFFVVGEHEGGKCGACEVDNRAGVEVEAGLPNPELQVL